jgi:hypothetical protein
MSAAAAAVAGGVADVVLIIAESESAPRFNSQL